MQNTAKQNKTYYYKDGEVIEDIQSIIDEYRYFYVELDDWFETILEDWKEALAKKGYLNAEINFSGFCTQGSGASFTADIDLDIIVQRFKKDLIPIAFPDIYLLRDIAEYYLFKINRVTNRYVHENTCNTICEIYYDSDIYGDTLEKIGDLLEKAIEEDRLTLCREIYKSLEEEYDYLTSDTEIIEGLLANEIITKN